MKAVGNWKVALTRNCAIQVGEGAALAPALKDMHEWVERVARSLSPENFAVFLSRRARIESDRIDAGIPAVSSRSVRRRRAASLKYPPNFSMPCSSRNMSALSTGIPKRKNRTRQHRSQLVQTFYFILAGVLIVIGIAGTVVPVLPGVPLVFGGMWLAAWADQYRHVGIWTLLMLGLLSAFALLIDLIASIAGAKRVGATSRAIWGASIGMPDRACFSCCPVF